MWLALSGLYQARWTQEIHHEWKRNLLKNRSDLTLEQLDRTSHLMDLAIPDACIDGYEDLVSGLTLPDENDRHVLAAAIRCGADVIVTFNLKDFPPVTSRHTASKLSTWMSLWKTFFILIRRPSSLRLKASDGN